MRRTIYRRRNIVASPMSPYLGLIEALANCLEQCIYEYRHPADVTPFDDQHLTGRADR